MPLVQYAEKTRTRRFASRMVRSGKSDLAPKALTGVLKKHAGRSGGRITVRHQGGRHKRQYRIIDFLRNKFGIEGTIVSLEYDPNRNVDIALVKYPDGEYRYMLAPKGLKVEDKVISGEKVDVRVGNAMKLKNLPIGTLVHNVEMNPGRGGQMGRAAGTSIMVAAKQDPHAHLRLPSGEIRMVSLECLATVGTLGNEEWKNMILGKAGRSRQTHSSWCGSGSRITCSRWWRGQIRCWSKETDD
jgi:large subunit ribosomal protein L2